MRYFAQCFAVVFLVTISHAQRNESPELLARKFVEILSRNEFAKAYTLFDETMSAAITGEKLGVLWRQIIFQNGAFRHQKDVTIDSVGGYVVVKLTAAFERSDLIIQLSYDTRRMVAGLYFKPPKTKPLPIPSYLDTSSFTELPAVVSHGEYALPATISMPTGIGMFPAVVLVHGSGPNDRDESIGPNKPFRDLAWGLASRGIVVLRYDKRTRSHPQYYQSHPYYTVKDEVTDDADSAVVLLSRIPNVDAKRVYLLGHSLGAYLAPRIAHGNDAIAGVILLSSPTRHLEDIALEQIRYIAEQEPQADKQTMDNQITLMQNARDEIRSLTSADSSKTILGVPGSYWLDLRQYDVVGTASSLKQPVFIAHGERDYQVTMTDFEGWKSALVAKENIVIKSYPKLNHLFIEGEGKSVPSEYQREGFIPEYVIEDIAHWLRTCSD